MACTCLGRTRGEQAWGQKGRLGMTRRLEGALPVGNNEGDSRDLGHPPSRGRPCQRGS